MLNRLIQPSQHFHVTIREMAKLLGIPPQIIVRIELWAHVIFVHRKDRGGQFVSYRKLERWKYAVACQIQKCTSHRQLYILWNLIEADRKKYSKQYKVEAYKAFIKKVWNKQWDKQGVNKGRVSHPINWVGVERKGIYPHTSYFPF